MKKDVLLIAHFCDGFDKGNDRFNYLAKLLTKSELMVELVTTNFSHYQKSKRSIDINNFDYKVTLLPEPGYKKNVSLKRFHSHYIMGCNLKKYLDSRTKPDLIYCAVPSLDLAKIAAKYAYKNNIRFIIDVQDLWPEAFKMIFNIPLVSNILYYPIQLTANYIYSRADDIIAVSQTYADRALAVSKKCKESYAIFLGTELVSFDKLANQNKITDKPKDEIWLAYCGTLGHSYDLTTVIDAIKILSDKGMKNIKFIVMGDGPLKNHFSEYAHSKGIFSFFTGRLEYGKMVGLLSSCDLAVNPITKNSAASIINKHADYAAAGLPVINTQESKEYRHLIERYNAGLNCINNNSVDLSEKLLILCNNAELRKTMAVNSRRLAEEKFDRSKTYQRILTICNSNT